MDTTVQLTHERVDDVPLLLGFLIKLRFPQLLDQSLPPHPHHQGLSQGWLISIWIAYILSHADHRKSHVRDWARDLHHTLEACTGQTIRDVDFTDDRLTLVLARLSNTETWDHIETELWAGTCEVYALPVERVRLDSTTSYGFHTIVAGGLMQLGHSKDHRPDLPQFKLMAAAAEPSGQLIAATVHPGDAADDPLYLPMIARVRALLGRTGLLYTGDCKMAALETRAEIAASGDFYLTSLPMTGATKVQFDTWVEDAVSGARRDELVAIRIGEDTLGTGYEFTRDQTAILDGIEQTWTERVQVIRSDSLAETQTRALNRRLEKAEAAVRALTPPPGPGRVQFTTGVSVRPNQPWRGVVASLPEPSLSSPGDSSCSDSDRRQIAGQRQEWWRRQIQRQQDGSLSIAEFCRRLGVSTVTFYAWRRRFREAPPASPLISERPAAKPSTANGAPAPAFLPVSMLDAGPDGQLEIELANACVVRLKGSRRSRDCCGSPSDAAGRLGDHGRGAD